MEDKELTMKPCVEVKGTPSQYISIEEKLFEVLCTITKESVFSVSKIQEAIAAAVAVLQKEDAADDSVKHRGRQKVMQLLGCYKDSEVCSWFDKIRKRLCNCTKDLLRLMVCFFCGLADIVLFRSYGRGACFYRMIKAHLQEKIPSMSMFQKAVKWFKGWRVEVLSWKNKKAEEGKHRLWERLCQKIKEELLRLEPQLAMAY